MKENVITKIIKEQDKKRLTDQEMVNLMKGAITRQRWQKVHADPDNAGGIKVLKGILLGFPGHENEVLDFIKNS